MKEIPYSNKISPKMKAVIIILGLVFIGVIIGFVVSTIGLGFIRDVLQNLNIQPTDAQEHRFSNLYTASIVINCIDATLLVGILIMYIDSYRKTKSSFLMGLTFFIGVLLARSLLSLVTIQSLFTEYVQILPTLAKAISTTGVGSFSFLLNVFEIIAVSILLYLSME
ncbi:MAG TPA: hypothetical protein DSN98_02795 [Thermoplasmata archaeon]|jgi:hypothetical protein|nr:MAG TPA: hypothetical protein DSN98_02795 [Thermoplasmata archaeon]